MMNSLQLLSTALLGEQIIVWAACFLQYHQIQDQEDSCSYQNTAFGESQHASSWASS